MITLRFSSDSPDYEQVIDGIISYLFDIEKPDISKTFAKIFSYSGTESWEYRRISTYHDKMNVINIKTRDPQHEVMLALKFNRL